MTFPPSVFEDLRRCITLSEVISRRITIIPSGKEYKALCPFHKERTPSFYINDQKGTYYCFGCHMKGNALDFVRAYEGFTLNEAVEYLIRITGLPFPRVTQDKPKNYQPLYDLLNTTALWFERELYRKEGRKVLEYLNKQRHLRQETLERFRIGFAPKDSERLRDFLLKTGYSEQQLLDSGLFKQTMSQGPSYSFFRNRIMFPIWDLQERVIAFGGRLVSGQGPKYLNSLESDLFQKKGVLYNFSQARKAVHKGQPVLVVEGYTDVVLLVQEGYDATFSPLGTALTNDHIQRLWDIMPQRRSKRPILCFDGDDAGRQAAERTALKVLEILRPNHSVDFVFLEESYDPDSFLRKQGQNRFDELVRSPFSLVDLIWNIQKKQAFFDIPEEKARFKKDLEAQVKVIPDPNVRRFYDATLKKRLYQEVLKKEVSRKEILRNKHLKTATESDSSVAVQEKRLEYILLSALLNHPQVIPHVAELLARKRLQSPVLESLRQELLDLYATEKISFTPQQLLTYLRECGHHQALVDLLNQTFSMSFTRSQAPIQEVYKGVRTILQAPSFRQLRQEKYHAAQSYFLSPSQENLQRYHAASAAYAQAEKWEEFPVFSDGKAPDFQPDKHD